MAARVKEVYASVVTALRADLKRYFISLKSPTEVIERLEKVRRNHVAP